MWLSMLAWSVVLKFALIMKLGEYGRAADRALPADISLPPVAVRSSMIAYLPYCTPPDLLHRGSRTVSAVSADLESLSLRSIHAASVLTRRGQRQARLPDTIMT
jgi:hypothetical protein